MTWEQYIARRYVDAVWGNATLPRNPIGALEAELKPREEEP